VKLQGLQGAAGRFCERSATTTETAANPSWIRQVPSLQPCKGMRWEARGGRQENQAGPGKSKPGFPRHS
jgi:hypothetical protein